MDQVSWYLIYVSYTDSLYNYCSVLEAGLTGASVLISLGAVLGKLNPLQILVLSLVETGAFVFNAHIGYKVLGAVDVGKINFRH